MNDRLQTVITFGVSVSLAIPVLAAPRGLSFRSPWFVAAAACFILGTTVGGIGRLWGKPILVSPGMLYKNWLHHPAWRFKKDIIYRAAQHHEANKATIEKKALIASSALLLFILDLVLAAAWAALTAPSS